MTNPASPPHSWPSPSANALGALGKTPVVMPATASLKSVLAQLGSPMAEENSYVLLVENETLVGLVTDRDAIRLLVNGVSLEDPIAQHMTTQLTHLAWDRPMGPLEVVDLMRQRHIHHLPVVDDQGRPVRMISVESLQVTLMPPHMLKLQAVRSRMTPYLATACQTDSTLSVAKQLAEYQINCVAVVDAAADGLSALVGVVLRQDVLRFQSRQLDLAQLPVQAVMREVQFCLQPSDSLWLAYQEMSQRRLPCLVVVTPQRQPLGVITQADLLHSLDHREVQSSLSELWRTFRQSEHDQVELWKTHSAELERLVQTRTKQLEDQAKADRLLTSLTQRIHESLDMQDILSTTVGEVRQLLQADRAMVYQFGGQAKGEIVVESVVPPWTSLLGQVIEDECFAQHWAESYRYGRIQAVEDIHQAGLSPCHVEMLATLNIRANLVVPIVCDARLWGLLVINQCGQPRRWHDWEIRLIEQLARSVAIAIRQSEYYHQLQADIETRKDYEQHLQQLNDALEHKVAARTIELQQSETKFRSLVEQTNDWVWEMDDQFCFSYINPRATEMLGYSPSEILGHRFSDFMVADEAVRFSTILSHLIQQRQPFTQIETSALHAEGKSVVLEISGSPIFDAEGGFQGYRGITRDITERKQVEVNIRKALTREKELSDLKTRFISMASHEFRTPLTTILASAETLERYSHKFTPEKQQAILHRIQSSVHHVIGLLNDVLTVGKTEAGKLTCNPAPLDLKQFCQDLVEELQFAQTGPISPIALRCQGDTFQAMADEKLLRHILINLLSNAIKYSPNHQPITVALTCTADETVFAVQDHGIGIPAGDQAQLFEAFHRADNVGNISGTGLGMVIAKRAAEAHQGRIAFTSAVGVGTTFTVTLPLDLME